MGITLPCTSLRAGRVLHVLYCHVRELHSDRGTPVDVSCFVGGTELSSQLQRSLRFSVTGVECTHIYRMVAFRREPV